MPDKVNKEGAEMLKKRINSLQRSLRYTNQRVRALQDQMKKVIEILKIRGD